MTNKELATYLERFNKWRRGADGILPPNATELGLRIDEVVEVLMPLPVSASR